jgi:hypothetical protein
MQGKRPEALDQYVDAIAKYLETIKVYEARNQPGTVAQLRVSHHEDQAPRSGGLG